jgi:hypothetical protein
MVTMSVEASEIVGIGPSFSVFEDCGDNAALDPHGVSPVLLTPFGRQQTQQCLIIHVWHLYA